MRLIAIVTDFGLQDPFVAAMKGVIFSINPRARIVDISHAVEPQDVLGGALLLKSSYSYFPQRTVFLAVIDPGVGGPRKPLVIETARYFFVGPDNGLLLPAAREDRIKKIVTIEKRSYIRAPVSDTFHGRDIFAPVAAHLSKGKPIARFGRQIRSVADIEIPRPSVTGKRIAGTVLAIDRFGNVITNIDQATFARHLGSREFSIILNRKRVGSIARSYQSVRKGCPLAIFGSMGYLELSVNSGSAERFFRARKQQVVTIEFGL